MAGQGDLTRRSFLVRIGATVLGTYLLPALDTGAAAETTGEQEQGLPVRLLFNPPLKTQNADGFFLLWTESRDGEVSTRIWVPEDEKDTAEAQRFYDDARRLRAPLASADPSPLPRRSAEENALLRACHDKPDDEDRHLDYARWLERRGSTYGEFARLWIEIERFSADDPRWEEMNARMVELLDTDARQWFQPLLELGLEFDVFGEFKPAAWMSSWGFLQSIRILRGGIIPERAEQLFYHAPLLQKIHFNYENLDFKGIASCSQMAQVTQMDLSSTCMTGAELRTLTGSPHLIRLRELDLAASNPLGPEGGEALAVSPLLSRLQSLDLEDCSLSNKGLRALCTSPGPMQMTTLDLKKNGLSGGDLSSLSRAPLTEHLTTLLLDNNALNAKGIRSLRAAPFLRSLTALSLSGCDLDTEAACAFASLPFTNLTSLDLGCNQAIGVEGVRALAASPTLTRLQQLNLAGWEMGESGMEALAASPLLAGVTDLDLGFNELGVNGLRTLLGSPHLGKLTVLNLHENKLGADAAKALAMSPALADLTELYLWWNPLGPGGAIVLSKSPYLKKLERLFISAEAVGEAGQKVLLATFGEDVMSLI